MAGEPDPALPAEPTPPAPPGPAGGSFLDKVGPHALKIMLGAAVVGAISCFLPAMTSSVDASLESLGVGVRGGSSPGPWKDWRGTICLLGYIGIAVMAGMMLQKQLPYAKQLTLASLITAGVVALMAFLFLLAISNSSVSGLGISVSTGIGTYLNFLAALVVVAGAVIQAKRAKLF